MVVKLAPLLKSVMLKRKTKLGIACKSMQAALPNKSYKVVECFAEGLLTNLVLDISREIFHMKRVESMIDARMKTI